MKIDKKIIEELVGYLKEFNLSEIEYAEGTTKVKVSRAMNNSSIISTDVSKKKTIIESNGTNVTSPIVGTAYLAIEPGAKKFVEGVKEMDEVVEFYRLSGTTDYLLKVLVPSIDKFDEFYKKLTNKIDLSDVTTSFSMEEIKQTNNLPLNYI